MFLLLKIDKEIRDYLLFLLWFSLQQVQQISLIAHTNAKLFQEAVELILILPRRLTRLEPLCHIMNLWVAVRGLVPICLRRGARRGIVTIKLKV